MLWAWILAESLLKPIRCYLWSATHRLFSLFGQGLFSALWPKYWPTNFEFWALSSPLWAPWWPLWIFQAHWSCWDRSQTTVIQEKIAVFSKGWINWGCYLCSPPKLKPRVKAIIYYFGLPLYWSVCHFLVLLGKICRLRESTKERLCHWLDSLLWFFMYLFWFLNLQWCSIDIKHHDIITFPVEGRRLCRGLGCANSLAIS